MIVAAHADDEVLGCGGTIARHSAEGDQVHLVIMADGVKSRKSWSADEFARREHAAGQAHTILGIKDVRYLGFPDNKMDSIPVLDVIQALEPIVDQISPQVIYTHHYCDLNVDHRITYQAVMTACRALPDSSVTEIYAFEVLSSTEWAPQKSASFVPNMFVNISGNYLSTKVHALEAYADEMRKPPHTRSIEHASQLALHRGSCVGVAAAEAFETIRVLR